MLAANSADFGTVICVPRFSPLVVIPTYNERDNIDRMLEALCALDYEVSVLIVDDSSPDGTADLVKTRQESSGFVHLLERPAKSGLGSAYRDGFAWAISHGFSHVVEMDADFSHRPEELERLLAAARGGADLVIGSRYIAGGVIPQWSRKRRWLSRGGNIYASTLLRLRVLDATSGYRAYSAGALEKMKYHECTTSGYGFQIDMTDRAVRAGLGIVEVPITFSDRQVGQSKMSTHIVTEALGLVTRRFFERLWASVARR